MTTRSKIRAVGNSRGVILPKKYLEQCGIEDQVDISIKDNIITIAATKTVTKKKWADFNQTSKKEKIILVANKFDDQDWTW
jgi:antitoxin component of MazEF toxin-antitoxin module